MASEEDTIDLIVKQYRENGTKLLDAVAEDRQRQMDSILNSLKEKKKDLRRSYSETREYVLEISRNLKHSSVGTYEKKWGKKQNEIQRKIAEARRRLEQGEPVK